jgi:hypothetical protein
MLLRYKFFSFSEGIVMRHRKAMTIPAPGKKDKSCFSEQLPFPDPYLTMVYVRISLRGAEDPNPWMAIGLIS